MIAAAIRASLGEHDMEDSTGLAGAAGGGHLSAASASALQASMWDPEREKAIGHLDAEVQQLARQMHERGRQQKAGGLGMDYSWEYAASLAEDKVKKRRADATQLAQRAAEAEAQRIASEAAARSQRLRAEREATLQALRDSLRDEAPLVSKGEGDGGAAAAAAAAVITVAVRFPEGTSVQRRFRVSDCLEHLRNFITLHAMEAKQSQQQQQEQQQQPQQQQEEEAGGSGANNIAGGGGGGGEDGDSDGGGDVAPFKMYPFSLNCTQPRVKIEDFSRTFAEYDITRSVRLLLIREEAPAGCENNREARN